MISYIRCGKGNGKECGMHMEKTELEMSGLNPVELEFMYPAKRREVLRAAGLNPDEYDF